MYRWSANVEFRAAFNCVRRDLRDSRRRRLAALGAAVVDCIESAVRRGNVKTALTVAEALGSLEPWPIGAHGPDELRRQAEAFEREQEAQRAEDELRHARRLDDVDDGYRVLEYARLLRPP